MFQSPGSASSNPFGLGYFGDSHSLSVKRADSRTGGAFSNRSSVNKAFLRTGAGKANVQVLWPETKKTQRFAVLSCSGTQD